MISALQLVLSFCHCDQDRLRSFLLPTGITLMDKKGFISSQFATKPPHALAIPRTWAGSSGSFIIPQSQLVYAGFRSPCIKVTAVS